MTFSQNNQVTRDALGSEPDTQEVVKVKTNSVITLTHPVQTTQDTIGNSWIVGSSTNGIVGTNTGTQGGGQQVVGSSGRVQTVQKVVCANDTVWELFNYTTFDDTGTTTATWSGNGSLVMTNTEIAQSLTVYKDTRTVLSATMTVTLSSGSVSDLTIQLSADGGSNFETVTNSTLHTFTNTGTDLRWKLTASGSVTVDRVLISFTAV